MVDLWVSQLDEKQRAVVDRRFGLHGLSLAATLEQIGTEIGVTRERVRQIQLDALKNLKADDGKKRNLRRRHSRLDRFLLRSYRYRIAIPCCLTNRSGNEQIDLAKSRNPLIIFLRSCRIADGVWQE